MKKITLVLICVCFGIIEVSAGCKWTKYKNCTMYNRRWYTECKAFCPTVTPPTSNSDVVFDGGCHNAYTEIFKNFVPSVSGIWTRCNVSSDKPFGFVKIHLTSPRSTQCNGGYSPFKLLSDYYQKSNVSISNIDIASKWNLTPPPPPPTYTGITAKDTASGVEFDSTSGSHEIIIKDFFVNLEINSDYIDSQFINLTIEGVYNKQGDSIVDNDSIFSTINVYMEGSSILNITGIDENQFVQANSSEDVVVSFVGGDLVISVPENLDFDKVGVSVTLDAGPIIGSGGNFVLKSPNSEKPNSDFQIKNIFPNPSNNIINLSINSSRNTLSTIKIINELGQQVYLEEKVLFSKGDNFNRISSEFLKPGTYFLIIDNDENHYSLKFIKN